MLGYKFSYFFAQWQEEGGVGGSRIEFGWMRWYLSVGSLIVMLVCPLHGQESRGLRFEVELEPSLPAQPPGRVLVVMAPSGRVEPRELIGRTGLDATPTVGVDAPRLAQGESVILDTSALAFPISTESMMASVSPRRTMSPVSFNT